jgi:hypothetical protein
VTDDLFAALCTAHQQLQFLRLPLDKLQGMLLRDVLDDVHQSFAPDSSKATKASGTILVATPITKEAGYFFPILPLETSGIDTQ